jgi:hypothetical protein
MPAAALALGLGLATALGACKGGGTEDGPGGAASTDAEVRAGFEALLKAVETCEPAAFRDAHTQKAGGALDALDAVVTAEGLAAAGVAAGEHAGARWACEVARKAGFVAANVKLVKISLNPKIGTARVIFTLRDMEYGFPMARQFGKWRSPFPGYVFLATEYRDWRKALAAALPDPARMPDLETALGKASAALEGYQPDWREYPDLEPKRE